MPVSPAHAEELAAEVVAHYAEAERQLLTRIARRLARGADSPGWAAEKLAQVSEYRREAELLLRDLRAQAATGVETAIAEAYERGGLSAVADLAKAGRPEVEALGGLRAVEALTAETLGYVSATHARILRSTLDAYRDVIAEAAEQVLLGTQTRLQAAQAALDRFAEKGITGFVDKAGRGWDLSSYTEMAMRTGTGKAAVQGHVDRLQANGIDLVIVSDAPRECPLCRPWEGKVLSLSGRDQRYPSLADAHAAGLQHTNCRHSVSAFIPGVTPPMKGTADPEGYAATTKLRYLERQVRASKRMQAAAMDDAALAAAKARTRAYQAKIRDLVATTSAKRQPYRERLGAR
jgi:hypothetical protein